MDRNEKLAVQLQSLSTWVLVAVGLLGFSVAIGGAVGVRRANFDGFLWIPWVILGGIGLGVFGGTAIAVADRIRKRRER